MIIIAIVTPKLLDLNRYHGFIVSEVEKAVGGKVKLGRISWGVKHRIWLEIDGFSIVGASAFHGDVKLTRIYTRVSIPQLLTRKVVLQNLQLQGAEVKFGLAHVQKDMGPQTDDTKSTGVHLPVEIEIQQLAVAIKRLELDDALTLPGQTLVHVFSDVDLAVTNIAPAKVMAFNLSFRDNSPSGLGSQKVQGTFSGLTETLTLENPELKLSASLEALQVDAIKPYLKNSRLENQLSGSISMKANCEVDLEKNNFHTQGVIDLTNLTYKDSTRWDVTLPGQQTTISFQIDLDPQKLIAEKISFKLGSLSLDARAELHGWKKDPVITDAEFSADLPLLDMMPLIPWKLLGDNADLVRPILQGGGKIVINKVTFPEINFAKLPATVDDLLTDIEMTAQVVGVSVKPSSNLPQLADISGTVSLKKNVLVAENMHARIGPIALPTLSFHITDIAAEPKGTLRINGPLQMARTSDAQIEKLLMQHGLKDLTGSADIDMRADFDQHRPADWTANGSLVLKGVRAETHPAAVVLENMEGAVQFNRQKAITITVQDLRAQINQAPVRMSGRFINVGAPDMLIATKVHAKQLDLSHLAALIPSLKGLKLSGKLDMNVDVHVPYATPAENRLTGTLTTRNIGFHLAAADLSVENGNTQIVLAGNSATVKTMTLNINDQQIAVSGQLSNPLEPNAKLLITSPDLNLDRFLPQIKAKNLPPKGQKGQVEKPAIEVQSSKRELPPLARKLTADLQVKAEQGRYRGLQFQKLNLNLQYKHAVIEHYALDFGVDQGRIHMKGAVDLRDLDRIVFSADQDITALHAERIAPIFRIGKPHITGPMALKSQYQGRTGNQKGLLTSLTGNLEIEMGPGRFTKDGRIGALILKIFYMTSIRGLFSGSIVDDLSDKGFFFDKIKAQATFNKGIMTLKNYHLTSDAMFMDLQGDINLIDEQLDLVVVLEPLKHIGAAIGSVPLVGKAEEDLTKIYLEIKGLFEKPEIRLTPANKIGEAAHSVVKESETIINDVVNRIEK